MFKQTKILWPVLLLLAGLLVIPAAAQAGFLDDLQKAGRQSQRDIRQLGRDVKGLVGADQGSSSSASSRKSGLPGGVSSRLKKINTELDKAESAMTKGAGSDQDRAKRAQRYLTTAQRYRSEIERNYKGKFPPDHPDVKAVDERLAKVEQAIASAGSASAEATASSSGSGQATPPAASGGKLPSAVSHRLKSMYRDLDRSEKVAEAGHADQARYKLNEAKTYLDEIKSKYGDKAPADHPDMAKALARYSEVEAKVKAAESKAGAAQATKQQARQSAANKRELCEQWEKKLQVYTQGPKGLHPYATDDSALITKWKGYYDEASALRAELAKVPFEGGKCPGLKSNEELLARYMGNFEGIYAAYQKKHAEAAAVLGSIVFSKSPINPASPSGLTTSFQAGDNIYALVLVKKSFAEIFKKEYVRIDVTIDGKKIHAQFIKMQKDADWAKKTLLFEIAPAPDKMTAYSNPDFVYGTSKANLRQGPQEMTLHLSQLGGGKHTVAMKIAYYGKVWAEGSFTIEGGDFGFYADLHKKAQASMLGSVTLPKAKMENPGLKQEMMALLTSAGWKDIHRLNIVDKDWWIDRFSGGNSGVKSRHMDAAVLAKGGDGKYFYKKVRFHQPRLISGAWGKLYISHTGPAHPVPKESIDK